MVVTADRDPALGVSTLESHHAKIVDALARRDGGSRGSGLDPQHGSGRSALSQDAARFDAAQHIVGPQFGPGGAVVPKLLVLAFDDPQLFVLAAEFEHPQLLLRAVDTTGDAQLLVFSGFNDSAVGDAGATEPLLLLPAVMAARFFGTSRETVPRHPQPVGRVAQQMCNRWRDRCSH